MATTLRILAIDCDQSLTEFLKDIRIPAGTSSVSPTIESFGTFSDIGELQKPGMNDVIVVQSNRDALTDLAQWVKLRGIRPIVFAAKLQASNGKLIGEYWDLATGRNLRDVTVEQLVVILGLTLDRQELSRQEHDSRQKLDRKNSQLEKMSESVYRCFDQIAHEFRSPLTVIREFTELMTEGMAGPTSETQSSYLRIIEDRSEELRHIVDDMIDIRKSQMGHLTLRRQSADLSPRIATVISRLQRRAQSKDVQLSLEVASCLRPTFCDIDKVQRAIFGCVLNAVKFAEKGDEIKVIAKRSEDEGDIIIEIWDPTVVDQPDGLDEMLHAFQSATIGFDPEQGQMFGPGLGMARELIRRNFGTFTIVPDAQRGTCFRITVPILNPSTIAIRFLDSVDLPATTPFGLYQIRPKTMMAQDPFTVIDDFIQNAQDPNSFIYPITQKSWLWLLAGDDQHRQSVCDGIQRRWKKVRDDAPVRALPELAFDRLISWNSSHDRQAIASAFESCCKGVGIESPARRRLLLARNDHHSLASFADRLESFGYEVITALDASKCVETAIEERPDAILIDSGLPSSEGTSVFDDLKNRGETMHLPVVLLTEDIRDQQKALEDGARHVMRKPFEPVRLKSTLERAMTPMVEIG